jgi:biotin carboxyl carrier protein
MPGRIVRIHVAEGDHVAANEPLLVLEAMKMEHVIAAPGAGRVVDTVALRGDSYRLRLAPPPGADRAAGDGHDAGSLAAPMPGRIVRIHVAEGDHVAANEPLLVLEAMKMEHVIAAAEAGRVGRLLVDVGDQVTRGTPLVALEPSHAAGAAAGESKP